MKYLSRLYTGAVDLEAMQNALAKWSQTAGDCIYLHVGDIPHRVYNGMRGRFPVEEIVRIWENQGEIIGFVCCYPYWEAYDALVSPDFRGGDIERELLEWAYKNTRFWMDKIGTGDKPIVTDWMNGDTPRLSLFQELGYQEQRPHGVLTERSLLDPIPESKLSEGYHIRSAAGLDEAGKLAAVHMGAFNSKWTPELYRDEVMSKPGYVVDREMVVVAPDGRFAAFCVYWVDIINGVGYFEPVGTHKDFQRQGIGRALMNHTLRLMRQQGLIRARVIYESGNQVTKNFYTSLGFQALCQLIEFAR